MQKADLNLIDRQRVGSSIAEFPVVIFVFLLVLIFPLIDLVTLFMGVSSVHSACRNAAVEGARAPSFATNVSPTRLSATNQAKSIASGLSTQGVSITPDDVQVRALRVRIADGRSQPITPSPDLAIDTTQNIYQIEVTVTGRVTPLVMLSSTLFGNVPGLTQPLVVTTTSTATFENPDGLTG